MTYKILGADGKEYGPVTSEVLKQWVAEGRLNAQSRVQPENTTDWKTLAELPDFASLFVAAAPTPAPLPVSPSAPLQPKTNSLAIAGLVLGILSVTLGLCCCYGLPFSIPGIICSAMALSQIKKNPTQPGRGMAIAGLVISIIGVLVGIGIMIVLIATGTFQEWMRRFQHL